MARQVTMTDDVAAIAERLAEEHGTTLSNVISHALREFERSARAKAGRIEYVRTHARGRVVNMSGALDALEALSARTSRLAVPGASSDHSDLYDENGLPH